MAVVTVYTEKAESATVPDRGKLTYYCDTEAVDRPAVFAVGSRAVCIDTGRVYEAYVANTWTLVGGGIKGVTSDPASPVVGELWLRTDL